jgi:hypothetical protein
VAIPDVRSTVEAAEAALTTSTNVNGATEPSGTGSASQAPQTHYKSLEEADRAARDMQSKYDSYVAHWKPLEKWTALGGPVEISNLIGQLLEIAGRPDFRDYAEGKLAARTNGSNEPDEREDELLTDEQREIRDLHRRLAQYENGSRQSASKVDGELAGLRFERAERGLAAEYGTLWNEHREKIMANVLRQVRSGAMSLDAVNESVLHRAFVASFDSPKSFEDAFRKHFMTKEERAVADLNAKSTTAPVREAPGGAPVALAKTFWEAVELGKRDREAAQREGRALQ